jgi:uncharacterized membrane protein YeaQ/YmgE (transglycosylase-associated protein family)
MLSPTDYWISWAIIGALVGVMSLISRRSMTDAVFTRMFDGVLGACVGGELIRRWDATLALTVPGLLAAAVGSALLLYLFSRIRTV